MIKFVALVISAFAVSLAAPEADAKRFGGGNSIGQQRAAPVQRQAAPPAKPAQPAQAQPGQQQPGQAAAPANAAPAQQGFMGRWGGMLAGLGIGALLGSLFAGGLGSIGSLLLALLAGVAIFFVIRMLMSRRAVPQAAAAAPGASPVAFSGLEPAAAENKVTVPPIGGGAGGASVPPIGSGVSGASEPANASAVAEPAPMPPGFEKEPFLRVAKTSFIRLQAANDAGDLDDIRNFTTPEMYAELSMQVQERGNATQRTEVVSVDAELVEAVVEGDYAVASVRFYGLIREDDARNPEPFDEVWHVRQDQRKRNAPWLISGIQQRD